jgi:hypothetical protein
VHKTANVLNKLLKSQIESRARLRANPLGKWRLRQEL